MGKLKLDIFFVWQIGLLIGKDRDFLKIKMPFISVYISIGKYKGYGYNIFGIYFN